MSCNFCRLRAPSTTLAPCTAHSRANAPAEERKLYGVEVLVVNALRPQPHDSHFSLDEALALIRRVAPRRAYLTHMSHEMGLYAERSALLPEGVYLAYDGLEINVND